MSNIVKKKQYDFVNLAKFISAVFVIGIHTSPLQGLHPKLNYFTRCIVLGWQFHSFLYVVDIF